MGSVGRHEFVFTATKLPTGQLQLIEYPIHPHMDNAGTFAIGWTEKLNIWLKWNKAVGSRWIHPGVICLQCQKTDRLLRVCVLLISVQIRLIRKTSRLNLSVYEFRLSEIPFLRPRWFTAHYQHPDNGIGLLLLISNNDGCRLDVNTAFQIIVNLMYSFPPIHNLPFLNSR